MSCLTDEQIAAVALRHNEQESARVHLESCDKCQAKLAAMRQLTTQLVAAHADSDRWQGSSRSRLVASLSKEAASPQPAWYRTVSRLKELTFSQRIVAGGLSISTVVLLLIFVSVNSAGRLSAMERMLQAVRDVKSYSFRLSEKTTWPATDDQPRRIREMDDFTCWRAPSDRTKHWLGDFYAEMKAWRLKEPEDGSARVGKPGFHIKEIHPTGKPGIVIIFEHRLGGGYYFRTPPSTLDDIPPNSPIAKLQAIRDQSGEVLRELGSKEVDGKQARGYVVSFTDAAPFRGCSEVEVWVDAKTDLPLEFSWKQENEGVVDEFCITDCRWNIELDPQLFVTTPPKGLVDATPPSRQDEIDQITAALGLYAQLSGGKFPQLADGDAETVVDEMLDLAGFSGARQDAWKDDPKYLEIQGAKAGLQRLSRVLLDTVNTAYYGSTVGPTDADKALVWWVTWRENPNEAYLVIYGDLRTKLLSLAEWTKLVPTEVAARHLPE